MEVWQDELLLAIMECDATALSAVLDAHGDAALHAVLERREVGRESLYLLSGEVYPKEGALREVLGGGFQFEHEERRALLSQWLDMIGTRSGDTMLHLLVGGRIRHELPRRGTARGLLPSPATELLKAGRKCLRPLSGHQKGYTTSVALL